MHGEPDFIELFSDPELLQLMLFACPDGVIATDRENRVLLYTGASEAIFGFAPTEVLRHDVTMLFATEEEFAGIYSRLDWDGKVVDLEVMARRKGREPFLAAISAATLRDRSGAYSGTIAYVRDHSALRSIEDTLRASNEQLNALVQALAHVARHDQLTGLLHRGSAIAAAEDVLLSAGLWGRQPMGVVIFDLDHFKSVNDSYGHLVGDQVLAALAQVLLGAARTEDIIGRFGGEEFVAFLPGADLQAAERFAERVRTAIAETKVTVGDADPIEVTISAGAASIPSCADSLHEAIRVADDRLFIAKRGGRDRVVGTDSARPGRSAA
ncbi:MAG: diguanylate cyclase [Tepidiformaceae bacterium]